MTSVIDIIKGFRCEKCYPRKFGEIVDDSPENLFVYTDMSGATRCFCRKHMTFFDSSGAMKNHNDEDIKVGWGAKFVSDFLLELENLEGELP